MRKTLAIIAFIFALMAALCYATAFVSPIREEALLLLVIGNLAFFVLAIHLGRDPADPPMRIRFPKRAPRWVEHSFSLLMLLCLVNFAIVALRGTPISGGPHPTKKTISGVYVEISPAEYRSLRASEARLFTSIWFALNMGLAFTLWFKDVRRHKPSGLPHSPQS